MEHWSKRLRRALQERSWDYPELATRSGVSIENIKKYAQGLVDAPRHPAPDKLAEALGVTVGWLMHGERPQVEEPREREEQPAARSTAIVEIEVRAGAGLGGESLIENLTAGNGYTTSQDAARGFWQLPTDYLAELRVMPNRLRIVEIFGDSMTTPEGGGLHSGDRVMVDLGDTNPTPPGIFALWDGFGLVVKRLERVPRSEPPAIRVISDNPLHAPYELTSDEVSIVGRLVWYARKL